MLIALFTSRALLTTSFILFLLLTCFHKDFVVQLIRFAKKPLLIGMSFLFFIPFVTWFWAEDKQMWAQFIRIKIPLFLFPLAFAGDWQLSEKQWKRVAYFFLMLLLAGCAWSLWHYALDAEAINKNYLKAKLLMTPLDNDHVRYSLLVCIGLICSVMLFRKSMLKSEKIILALFGAFFLVYLHVLSARTGLLAAYIFAFAGLLYLLLFSQKRKRNIFLIAGILLLMPVAAWYFFPTFQNRIRYVTYDFSFVKNEKYLPGTSDGNRMVSYKAGWKILKENPFGVGADVGAKTNQWYDQNFPQMNANDRILPSSEFLMYAAFAGWISLALFILAMILPLVEKIKTEKFFWILLNVVMVFSFLFDIGLEAQFGVFIYSFVVLWWWKWLNMPGINST